MSVVSKVYDDGSLFRMQAKWQPDPTMPRKRKAIPQRASAHVRPARIVTQAHIDRKLAESRARCEHKLAGLKRDLAYAYGRLKSKNEPALVMPKWELRISELKSLIRNQEEKLARSEPALSARQQPVHPAPIVQDVALSVPVPSQRTTMVACAPSRDGQAAFRAAVLDAYGKCAVTGCHDRDALQAAHVIPYVDERSHVLSNGLCLRADVHCLYDRDLLRIGADMVVWVSPEVKSAEYRALHGVQVAVPALHRHRPCPILLSERHKHL